jgi:Protein of unknown function (DUF1376)
MKWYKHDPHRFLEGVIGLTPAERGAYITLIDLLYARAPLGNVTDELVTKAMAINPRTWRALKAGLMAKGKVHETPKGLIANGVRTELEWAANRMRMTRELRVRQLKNQDLRLNGHNWQRTDNQNKKDLS